MNIESANTQYAIVPLTFENQDGPVSLASGSLKATAPTGATATIVETPDDAGGVTFAVWLVTPEAAGAYAFTVGDNTPEGDNLVIKPLEITYTTTVTGSNVTIIPGTAEFRPKSEL